MVTSLCFQRKRLGDGGVRAMNYSMGLLTPHDDERVTSLCERIVEEKNPVVFRQLLIELDALLEKLNDQQTNRSGREGDSLAT